MNSLILPSKNFLLTSIFLLVFAQFSNFTYGQVVTQTEGHESSIFPAPGWKQYRSITSLLGAFTRQPYAGSTNPAVAAPAGGGANALMFNSWTAFLNDTSILITKPFDFSQNGGTNPTFSFDMYRDNGFTANNDKIEVFINTVPTTVGMVPITHAAGVNFINRPNTSFPAVTANTWNTYTFTLPAATYNQRRYYFIIRAIGQDGNNIYLDKFTTNTYPSTMLPGDVSFNLVQQNQSTTTGGATNQWILGVRCVVNAAGLSGCGNLFNANLPVKLDSLLFNTNGTSNVANITNAKIFYTGGSEQFNTNYISPFPVAPAGTTYPKTNFSTTKTGIATNIDFDNPAAGPCFYLEYDTTYFWLTYDLAVSSAVNNFLDADFRGAAIGGTGGCPSSLGTGFAVTPTVFTLTGAVQVDLPYVTPTYTVGTSANGYTNNDYVNTVQLIGFGGTSINTSKNAVSLQSPAASCYPNCNFTAHPPDYEYRSPLIVGQTAVVQEGGAYSITVGVGTAYSSNAIQAWIDWNGDATFAGGPVGPGSERLGYASLNALGTVTWNFTVPAGTAGNTRLRVREVFAAASDFSPTANFTYGECEDFVLTIIPNCPATYRLWLGNTNDWSNPSNWCPSIPTINDSVVVDKAQVPGVGSRPYFNPTIKSGVTANCKGIFIAATDTLTIDAPNPGSGTTPPLKVKGSVTINGQVKFNTSFNPEVTYSSGTLLNFTMTPLIGKFYKAAQTQIIYTAAELAAQGILNGDRITALKMNIKNNDLGQPIRAYQNFQIRYRNDAGVPLAHATTAAMPGPFTAVLTPATLNVAFGLLTINLSTPIVVNPAFNLCIEFSYANPGGNGSANNDNIDITQTTGRNSMLILGRLTTSGAVAPLPPAFVGTVAADITANGSAIASPTINAIATLRPNVTFVLDRPYTRPTVVIQGNFINNNSFLAGKSLILLDSASTQRIGGTQPSTFFDLEMAKTTPGTMTLNNARPVIMDQAVTVQDTLKLTAGQFLLNGRILTMTNPLPEALWRSQAGVSTTTLPTATGTGFLISESTASQVNWVVGPYSATRQRYIPFGHRRDTSAAGPAVINYIPVGFRHTAGDMGTFQASTYYAPSNLPLPPTVTHLNTYGSTNQNASPTGDRFWMIGKTGTNPVADLSFRLSTNAVPATERGIGWVPVASQVKVQPWRAFDLSWIRISDVGGATASLATVTNAVGSGTVITYTTATAHGFRIGSVITTAGTGAYNLIGAVIATTPTATTFTVNNGSVGVFTGPGTVTPTQLAVGGINLNARQTTLNYTQGYGQGVGFDSLRVTGYDWPTVPAQPVPLNTPAAPIGDFTPWALASNNIPLGSQITQTLSIQTDSIVNATCQTSTNGAIYISLIGGTAPYSYLWSSGSVTQDLTGLQPGNYTITVTDATGLSISQAFNVNAAFPNLNPIAGITGSTTICLPASVNYSIQPVVGATNYVWTTPVVGATIANGQGTTNININFAANYQSGNGICVIASNQCSIQQACITVNSTSSLPATPSTITGATQGICNSTRTYSVTNTSGLSYVWSVPSGASLISGQGTNAISLNFSSTFLNGAITVFATNACGSSAVKSKNVFAKPAKPTSVSGLDTLCIGTQATFTCPAAVGATSYSWTVPSGVSIVSGQGSNSIVILSNVNISNGSICVRAVNACGSSNSTCKTISVVGSTSPAITINGSTNGVCNSNTTYTATTINGGTYTWTVPSGCSIISGQGTNQILVSFTNSFSTGNINVTVSAPCVNSAIANKTVRGYPATPTSITGPTLVCDTSFNIIYTCATSATATNYNWVVPAGFTINSGQGTNSVIVNINTIGGSTGIIKAKANNACGASAFKTLNLTYQVCREGEFENNTINIYPNPANNEATIEISNATDERILVQCTNAIGQLLHQENVIIGSELIQVKLNTSNYSEGLYFISVTSKSIPTSVYKMVISR
jgi:hypothetical protein